MTILPKKTFLKCSLLLFLHYIYTSTVFFLLLPFLKIVLFSQRFLLILLWVSQLKHNFYSTVCKKTWSLKWKSLLTIFIRFSLQVYQSCCGPLLYWDCTSPVLTVLSRIQIAAVFTEVKTSSEWLFKF